MRSGAVERLGLKNGLLALQILLFAHTWLVLGKDVPGLPGIISQQVDRHHGKRFCRGDVAIVEV